MAISITNRAKNEFIHIIEEQKSQDPEFANKKQSSEIEVRIQICILCISQGNMLFIAHNAMSVT